MSGREISRRRFLRDSGAAAAAAGLYTTPAFARSLKPGGKGRHVAVLGGGMAGLATAHELIERGFKVTVIEPAYLGGKARSLYVPKTAAGGRRGLPGEHGFRFFPGFYHHVPNSMRRIPFPGNENGVWDNLVDANETVSPRTEGRADGTIFGVLPDPLQAFSVEGLRRILMDGLSGNNVPPHELAYFVNRLLVFLTSSDDRRYGQWEHVPWREFVAAEGKSEEYRKVISAGLTRTVVAAKEAVASTRTIGNMGEAFVYTILGLGNDGSPDRVLNLPTNEAWIDPWVAHLKSLGVKFRLGQKVTGIEIKRGKVEAVRVRDRQGRERLVESDWYVCAMPVERARKLWSKQVLREAPALELTHDLYTDWMVGVQYFLRRPVDFIRGHMTFVDAPWALTCLTQAQFWDKRDFAADYGDGSAVDCLSVDVSDWDAPGILYGKPAKQCSPKQVAAEVLAQIQAHVNDNGTDVLPSDAIHSWFIDPGVRWNRKKKRNRNATPLLVNTVGSWERRPKARIDIPNLFLAGDYIQTDVDLATMEGANESGRDAANAVLEAAGSNATPAAKYRLYDPPEFEAAKAVDAERFKAGQPNLLDV